MDDAAIGPPHSNDSHVLSKGARAMIRRTGLVAVVVVVIAVVLGCTRRGRLQPPSTPSARSMPDEATRLDTLVEQRYGEARFQEALLLAERSLALREKARGPYDPTVATSARNLAAVYQAQGAYAKAEPLFVRALAIREKVLGADHPDVAQSLNDLALLYQLQGGYAKAEPLFVQALDIREKALGAMHPDVAGSLNNLAALYRAQGAYAKAEPLFVRALDINEKAMGSSHLDVAGSLNNLAVLYEDQGAYAKAEPLLARALEIREKALGPTHPEVAQSLNNLAMLYRAQGAYAKAEPLHLRALEIREKALGPTHPDVAINLNNLAELYRTQGAYAKAEPLYLRTLEIREKVLGKMHPDVATSLNNLGMLYWAQGAFAKAEPLYLRALAIREKALGAIHPDVATSLNNLAELYRAQGAFAKAEPLHLRALDIFEKTLGPMHLGVALGLNNLAEDYRAQGAYEKAEPLHLRALEIREKALGAMHPRVAGSLNNLALLYQHQGAYAKAEPLYLRALDIHEHALGPMHPDVATSLNNLASLYRAQGASTKALPLVARAAQIRESQLRLELARLSEPRKRALMMLLQKETDSIVSLHADAMPSSLRALELALATVLRRKGRGLDSLEDNQLGLRAHLTPSLRDKLDQFTAASTELSTRVRAPFDPRTAARRAEAITTLRARVEELESELNAASAEFHVQSELITVAKIRAALPPGAALVEFVRYHRFDYRELHSRKEARYVAYVLPWKGPPKAVALGEAAPIDVEVDAVIAAMHMGTGAGAARAALRDLDTLVFAPLRGQLANVSHVILSPDDKLNLVPFEALVDQHGHYELERRLVSYVTSGRDLLRLATRRAPRSSATILAAPDYGPPSSPTRNGLGTFHPLEGAAAELAELPAYFVQARILTGDQATKAALAAMVGPAVLHIATHGFYARDAATVATSSSGSTDAAPGVNEGSKLTHSGVASTPTAASPPSTAAPPSTASPPAELQRGIYVDGNAFSSLPPSPADDPSDALDRAGLALAGANVRPDGIVSARELASYDWWGTQLVVLSACATGVGAVPSGEGVYGMRRALVLAGAESQVVSLWNANDASTHELMRAFYGELARGTGRAEALRRAKLRLLHQPRFAHPYYWAAFIPAGAWTPLDPHLLKQKAHDQ